MKALSCVRGVTLSSVAMYPPQLQPLMQIWSPLAPTNQDDEGLNMKLQASKPNLKHSTCLCRSILDLLSGTSGNEI